MMELLPPIGMHGGVLYGKRANLTIARAAYASTRARMFSRRHSS